MPTLVHNKSTCCLFKKTLKNLLFTSKVHNYTYVHYVTYCDILYMNDTYIHNHTYVILANYMGSLLINPFFSRMNMSLCISSFPLESRVLFILHGLEFPGSGIKW